MVHIVTSISRFLLIILFAIYTLVAFLSLRRGIGDKASKIYSLQTSLILLILSIGHVVIYLNTGNLQVLVLFLLEVVFIFLVMLIYKKIYKTASFFLVNNMCMLLSVGFIILTRLDIDLAKKQLFISTAALFATAFIPFLIRSIHFFDKLGTIYAAIGLIGLASVKLFGKSEYGANLSLDFGYFSIQPAEIIKVVFVFYVASRFYKSVEFRDLVKTTVVAALHVFILVLNRDLGAGLVFLITYLIMLYVATHKLSYLALGLFASAVASIAAYFLFSHVRARVAAWKDPLSVIDTSGFQVSQSLFAIGSGGFFGSGLTWGLPKSIPVVAEDFVFAAISEEMGAVFGLCLIFVCISCYLMFMNAALSIHNSFYKLVALGLSSVYSAQVFVSIGGVIKLIPSTGITLPLVSYGGSSILGTMLIFAIIQGLYSYKKINEDWDEDEYEEYE